MSGLTFGGYARAVVKARMRIGRYFDASLFADPAFDILLDLYASEEEGRSVTVTNSTTISRIPQTSAYRCIDALEERGLLTRQQDPGDGRRVFLVLTEAARSQLTAYIAEIAAIPLRADGGHR